MTAADRVWPKPVRRLALTRFHSCMRGLRVSPPVSARLHLWSGLSIAALLGTATLLGCSSGRLGDSNEDESAKAADEDAAGARSALGDGRGSDDSDQAQDDTSSNDDADAREDDSNADLPTDDTVDGDDDDVGTSPDNPAPQLAWTGAAVRLTRAEIDNTVSLLLGDDSAPGTRILAEDEFSPFDNDGSRQTVSAALVEAIAVLAADIAERALEPERRVQWMPCEPESATDPACFAETVSRLTRVFFRRPAPAGELQEYARLLSFAEEANDFYAAIQLLLTALIQDPEFLYRLERGTPGEEPGVLSLDDHEIAARLSFLIWGSGPNDALLDAAEAGALQSAAGRTEALLHLLADERAQRQVYRFHAMWLGYRTLPGTPQLNAAFQRETEHLLQRVLFLDPQSYLNVFSSPETFLTDDLAQHYDLPAPDTGEGWVSYPPDSGRAGILGHGSILSAFSKFSDTSPTQRGIFIRTRLLCQAVPPPPATVDVDQPPSAEEARCKLDRYRAHAQQSGCVSCHELFDPIGFGLENFDVQGRYRTADDADPECTIDGVGTLPGSGEFSGPAELSRLLVSQDVIGDCLLQHYLQFAWAKGSLSDTEVEYVGELSAEFSDTGYRFDRFLEHLVTQDAFARKQEKP